MELEVRDLSVSIDKRAIIQNVSARVGSRRFVGIVGPNGSGKSTLLKTIYRAWCCWTESPLRISR